MTIKAKKMAPLCFAVSSILSIGVCSAAAGEAIRVDAEDFVMIGGTFDDGQIAAVSTYTVNGATAINFVNKGDYLDYQVNIAEAGTYNIEYLIGTDMANGAEIEVLKGIKFENERTTEGIRKTRTCYARVSDNNGDEKQATLSFGQYQGEN